MIDVGDKVKDMVTGLEGIVVSITKYLNGCSRAAIQCKAPKDAIKAPDWEYFDVLQLGIIKKNVLKSKNNKTGGVQPAEGRRNYA